MLGRYRDVLNNMDVVEILPQVTAPCLVLHCRHDRMVPLEQARKMAAGLPNSQLRVYDSPNHIPPGNDPIAPLLHRDIESFLSEVS